MMADVIFSLLRWQKLMHMETVINLNVSTFTRAILELVFPFYSLNGYLNAYCVPGT